MKPNYEQQAREMAEQCAEILNKHCPPTKRKYWVEHDSAIILRDLNLAKLLEDAAMLDWLQNFGRASKFSDGWNIWKKGGVDVVAIDSDIRTAIHNAMKEES